MNSNQWHFYFLVIAPQNTYFVLAIVDVWFIVSHYVKFLIIIFNVSQENYG